MEEHIRVRGKKYKVIQIISKSKEQLDLFLCIDSNKIKTCFQRQDIDGYKKPIAPIIREGIGHRGTHKMRWSIDDVKYVRSEVANGRKLGNLAKELSETYGIPFTNAYAFANYAPRHKYRWEEEEG